jgi:MFS transporter, DHA2 family, multidrug resistance protein
MAGMLLFITQYLQLVRGMGPLEAGLWSVPAMVGSIAGSMLAPAVAARLRKELVLAGSMGVAALGLGVLALVSDGSTTLAVLVAGSLGMGLGAGAIGTVATDLIVGTAPPERAGAASGVSETGAELGGALGIAILGSIGTAVYGEDAFVQGLQLAALTGAALTAVAAAVAALVLLRFTAPAAGSSLAGSR